jgi:hypothetical protein
MNLEIQSADITYKMFGNAMNANYLALFLRRSSE